jgi:GH25 family lysozyme M1 (1,4-beta-N-acetylmuramidase)
MTANGIDVSNNNGLLNLGSFPGLDFVIAKVSESTNFADPTFSHYEQAATAAGVEFGAYHFLRAERLSGQSEALWFLKHCTPVSGRGIWIDYESYGISGAVDIEVISLFAMTVKAHFPKQKIGLYANKQGFAKIGHLSPSLAIDAYWLAEYNNEVETPDSPLAQYGLSWSLHQYEVYKNVDRDFSRWSREEMRNFFTW